MPLGIDNKDGERRCRTKLGRQGVKAINEGKDGQR
jgi:hypothetical protein